MLKRWNSKVYAKLLLGILEIILKSMNIEEKIKERNKEEEIQRDFQLFTSKP